MTAGVSRSTTNKILGRTTVTDVKARPNTERDKLSSGTARGYEREARRLLEDGVVRDQVEAAGDRGRRNPSVRIVDLLRERVPDSAATPGRRASLTIADIAIVSRTTAVDGSGVTARSEPE